MGNSTLSIFQGHIWFPTEVQSKRASMGNSSLSICQGHIWFPTKFLATNLVYLHYHYWFFMEYFILLSDTIILAWNFVGLLQRSTWSSFQGCGSHLDKYVVWPILTNTSPWFILAPTHFQVQPLQCCTCTCYAQLGNAHSSAWAGPCQGLQVLLTWFDLRLCSSDHYLLTSFYPVKLCRPFLHWYNIPGVGVWSLYLWRINWG